MGGVVLGRGLGGGRDVGVGVVGCVALIVHLLLLLREERTDFRG